MAVPAQPDIRDILPRLIAAWDNLEAARVLGEDHSSARENEARREVERLMREAREES